MKRDKSLPPSLQRSLEKFGADLRIARLKRNLTAAQMADALDVHRTTWARMEAGDPSVGLGHYARALSALGFGDVFSALADPRNDEQGMLLDLQRLPQRARPGRRRPIRFALSRPSRTREPVLRIGVIGAMSGPAAVWGLVNKQCAEITAEMYNEKGGIEIGSARCRIEIVCADDRLSPAQAAEGMQRMTEEDGVRYVIGPNVEQTFTAALPIAERNGAMMFPYAFTRSLYQPPRENAVLGQIAGYQAVPSIYSHLMEEKGVETIALVAPATPEGLRQRQEASRVATRLGMKVVSGSGTYRCGGEAIENAVEPAVAAAPDVLALPNVAPLDASRLIRHARALGFRGYVTTESAQDVDHLIEALGADADDVVMVGGACVPEVHSPWMKDFARRFVAAAGAWNDEAGTKVYALEFLLATLQEAGRDALDDVSRFKAAIPHVAFDNPLEQGRSRLAYYGAKEFRQKRQIGIPLVVNTIRQGRLQHLFTQRPDEILV